MINTYMTEPSETHHSLALWQWITYSVYDLYFELQEVNGVIKVTMLSWVKAEV